MNNKKTLFFGILVAISISFGGHYYLKIFSENLQQDTLVYIPSKASIENVKDSLMGNLKNQKLFYGLPKKRNTPKKLEPENLL